MAKATLTQKLDAPADEVWELIGGFTGIAAWHDLVDACDAEEGGSVRRLHNAGGQGQLVERLLKFDEEAKSYSYTIIGSVDFEPPVVNYLSVVTVTDDGDGRCTVSWTGSGDPAPGKTDEDCVAAWNFIYGTGLKNLAERFGAA
jgi:hypothetical protein